MKKILEAENRDVEAINIKNASKLIILYSAEKPEQLKQAIQLNTDLKKVYAQLEVHSLGWIKKEMPKYSEKLEHFSFFSKANYDFFFKPKNSSDPLNKILSHKYDILIDLSMEFVFPIKRLLLEIPASLRVGVFSAQNEPLFDLFINSQKNVGEFSKHAVHYLSILNNHK